MEAKTLTEKKLTDVSCLTQFWTICTLSRSLTPSPGRVNDCEHWGVLLCKSKTNMVTKAEPLTKEINVVSYVCSIVQLGRVASEGQVPGFTRVTNTHHWHTAKLLRQHSQHTLIHLLIVFRLFRKMIDSSCNERWDCQWNDLPQWWLVRCNVVWQSSDLSIDNWLSQVIIIPSAEDCVGMNRLIYNISRWLCCNLRAFVSSIFDPSRQ